MFLQILAPGYVPIDFQREKKGERNICQLPPVSTRLGIGHGTGNLLVNGTPPAPTNRVAQPGPPSFCVMLPGPSCPSKHRPTNPRSEEKCQHEDSFCDVADTVHSTAFTARRAVCAPANASVSGKYSCGRRSVYYQAITTFRLKPSKWFAQHTVICTALLRPTPVVEEFTVLQPAPARRVHIVQQTSRETSPATEFYVWKDPCCRWRD